MAVAKIVMHFEDGLWWAESPDLDGFTVVAPSLAALRVEVREAAAFHLGSDEPVEVAEVLGGAQSAADVRWVSRTGGAPRQCFISETQKVPNTFKASA